MYDYQALAEEAATNAARGCGLSDVLYENRIQGAYASILDNSPEELRAEVSEFLQKKGYEPNYAPYEPEADECSITGIEPHCCPCGRHE